MRNIVITVLALVPAVANADWVKVTEARDAVHYIDPATIRVDGSIRQAWEVQDFADKRTNGARSRRALLEFDCSAQRWRVLSSADHPESMAGGTALGTWTGQSEWSYVAARTGTNIPASSTHRTILRFVCAQ